MPILSQTDSEICTISEYSKQLHHVDIFLA